MGGPQSLIAWRVGALLAIADGLVFADLGSAIPASGGSYIVLPGRPGTYALGAHAGLGVCVAIHVQRHFGNRHQQVNLLDSQVRCPLPSSATSRFTLGGRGLRSVATSFAFAGQFEPAHRREAEEPEQIGESMRGSSPPLSKESPHAPMQARRWLDGSAMALTTTIWEP
jgi:hypothetical protein